MEQTTKDQGKNPSKCRYCTKKAFSFCMLTKAELGGDWWDKGCNGDGIPVLLADLYEKGKKAEKK